MNVLKEGTNKEHKDHLEELDQYLAVIELCKDLLEHKKRDTKILFIALIFSLCLNAAIVGAFLWYESGWEYSDTVTTTTEQTVDGENSSIVNGDQYNDQSQNQSNGGK